MIPAAAISAASTMKARKLKESSALSEVRDSTSILVGGRVPP